MSRCGKFHSSKLFKIKMANFEKHLRNTASSFHIFTHSIFQIFNNLFLK